MRVSCFGDLYSHTYAATLQILGLEAITGADIKCCDSIPEALAKVAEDKCGLCVVPVENSVEGTVTVTCDLLRSQGLYIVRELILPIKQYLIAPEGVKEEDVTRVYSHPQALAQCRGSLARILPKAQCEAVAYTSAGLNRLDGHSAAIARAPKEGQYILAEVQDSPDNSTRFIAVKSEPRMRGDKVSVVFSAQDKPGALLDLLIILREHGLNMTKIESRPAKRKLGQYVFYVDFGFEGDNSQLQELLTELGDAASDIRLLGRYERCKAPQE